MPRTAEQRRKRDPQRKRSILNAAARLVAERGYAGVTMADIGEEVGIAASAIYWHFSSKQHLLVALFDDCLDRLLSDQQDAARRLGASTAALQEITRLQVDFVVDEHAFAKVYYREASNLPAAELTRLRGKQRRYAEAWAGLLTQVRPDLDRPQAEDLVHAAIGAVQSALVHRSRLARPAACDVLLSAAMRVQGLG